MKIYTLEEVENILKIDRETLIELIENKELPAIKIKDIYRISDIVLREFINKKTNAQYEVLPPSYYLLSGGILDNVEVDNKEQLIEVLVESAYLHNDIFKQDMEEFKNLIKMREEMSSTGIGNGIAILHTRDIYKKIRKPFIMLTRLKRAIEFNSIDGVDVDIVFLIAMHNRNTHLKIMSMLVKLFHKNNTFIKALRECKREDIFNLFIEQEKILGN